MRIFSEKEKTALRIFCLMTCVIGGDALRGDALFSAILLEEEFYGGRDVDFNRDECFFPFPHGGRSWDFSEEIDSFPRASHPEFPEECFPDGRIGDRDAVFLSVLAQAHEQQDENLFWPDIHHAADFDRAFGCDDPCEMFHGQCCPLVFPDDHASCEQDDIAPSHDDVVMRFSPPGEQFAKPLFPFLFPHVFHVAKNAEIDPPHEHQANLGGYHHNIYIAHFSLRFMSPGMGVSCTNAEGGAPF